MGEDPVMYLNPVKFSLVEKGVERTIKRHHKNKMER